MEAFSQLQTVVVEHAFTIGIGLLIAVVVAGIAWYWMSRSSSSTKSSVLENQARVNSVEMDIPSAAAAPEPHESHPVEQEIEMNSQTDE